MHWEMLLVFATVVTIPSVGGKGPIDTATRAMHGLQKKQEVGKTRGGEIRLLNISLWSTLAILFWLL